MNRKIHTHLNEHRSHRGQSLVEFALLLPVLLLLILGAMDLASLFSTKIVLTNAAREGANYLTRNPEESGCITVIENELQSITLDIPPLCYCNVVGCESGTKVTATVTKEVDLFFGGSIPLSSTVEMMVQ